ncbi:MAG: hypothetical protein ACLT98_05550 [Eggerthellaceae bacterium]
MGAETSAEIADVKAEVISLAGRSSIGFSKQLGHILFRFAACRQEEPAWILTDARP